MPNTIAVLVVDDSAVDAELAVRSLRDSGIGFTHRIVDDESSFKKALVEFSPTVILCDFTFPDFDGHTALRIASDIVPLVPLIFVSGTISEERAVIAVQYGAVDYVLKSNLLRLPAAVRRAAELYAERMQRLDAESTVARLNRVREVLSAASSAILRLRDRNELQYEACRIASEIGGFAYSFIVSIDRDTGVVDVPAIVGRQTWPTEQMRFELQRAIDSLENATGVVAASLRTHRPAVINDLERSPAGPKSEAEALLANSIYAVGSFPLVVGGQIAGAMVFAASERGRFSDAEVALLTDLTGNLSIALDLREKHARIDYLSHFDALTDLPNRQLFASRLRDEIRTAERSGGSIGLALLDVANFETFNAEYGEAAGDDALRKIAHRLRVEIGEDRVARVFGTHFAVRVPLKDGGPSLEDLLGNNGIELLAEPLRASGREIRLELRAGSSVFPTDARNDADLLHMAEIALLSAKAGNVPWKPYSAGLASSVRDVAEPEGTSEKFLLDYTDGTIAKDRRSIRVSEGTLGLLMCLGVARDPVRRDVIVDRLWPDLDGDAAMNAFKMCLHRARAQLGEADVIVGKKGLFTLGDCLESNYHDVIGAATDQTTPSDGEVRRLHATFAKLTSGVAKTWAHAEWAWFAPYANALVHAMHRIGRALIRAKASSGDSQAAIAIARRIVEVDPLDEDARAMLVGTLIQAGDRDAARSELHDFSAFLKAETGGRPSARLLSIVEGSPPGE